MSKELTRDECFEIFEKYDPSMYKWITANACMFGCDVRNYARYLLDKHIKGVSNY